MEEKKITIKMNGERPERRVLKRWNFWAYIACALFVAVCEHWKAGNSWSMIMGTVYAPGTCGNKGKPRMNVAYACRGNFKEDKTRGCFIRFQGIISDETD